MQVLSCLLYVVAVAHKASCRLFIICTIESLVLFTDRSCLMFANTINISREKLFIYPPVRLYQFKCWNDHNITKVLQKCMGYDELIRTYYDNCTYLIPSKKS